MEHITKIFLNPEHELDHSGYLLGAALTAGASLHLDREAHPLVPLIQISEIMCAIDLFDSPVTYHEKSLARCDFYYKRSYAARYVPVSYAQKVLPFGLNYGCSTRWSRLEVLSLFARHRQMPTGLKSYVTSPTPAAFELAPTEPYQVAIFFQTRLWSLRELGSDDTLEEVNGFRVKLVQELKKTFGTRYMGGLVPTIEASDYPELHTKLPTFRWKFPACLRPPTIGIYTRGLHGSNAFKLAEYLASSKFIIGQQLAHTLPAPLGICHSIHETVDGILSACDSALSKPARLLEIRHASWHYYQSQLRYDRLMSRLWAGLAPSPSSERNPQKAA